MKRMTLVACGVGVMAGTVLAADTNRASTLQAGLHDAGKTMPAMAPLIQWDDKRVVTLVPTSEEEYQMWSYTTDEPTGDWTSPAYNDSAWSTGNGMFGTGGTPALRLGTEWSTSDIYLRRTFELDAIPLMIALRILHDDAATIYINGKCVATRPRWTRWFIDIPLDGRPGYLNKGENTLAVHCHQDKAGQNIDVGILGMMEEGFSGP